MDEKDLIIILERFNENMDILIKAQAKTIEMLAEPRKNSPPLNQLMAEWKSKYVSQY